MNEGSFPRPARRFDGVGFSEIVRVRNRVMDLLAAGQKVWRFEGGEPWMNTPEAVKAAMGDALARNQTRYAPSSGIPELRRAILAKARDRNGIPADDESPVVVNGGMQGLFAAFAALLDPGDEVLMFSPYWTPIADLIAYHEAKAVLVPTGPARRDGLTAALAQRVTARTRVLYWNCPNNPTGDVFSRREVEEVAAFARERNLAVVSDEAYEDLVYEGEPNVAIASLPGMYDRTITAFTLSKSYSMTGWRLGYVIAPKRYQSAVKTVLLYTTNGVSTPTQWAAVEALARGTDYVAEWKPGYRDRRDRLAAGLTAAGFELETPRAALYLFPKYPAWLGSDSREAARTLLDEAKIATVPGIVFGPEGEGHLRFSFSVSNEMIAGGVAALTAFASQSTGARR
ncbi:MAG TPA: aminotransferase class I/II-fold pyridoxal phosphate-dependent enzyme [Thermoanaerobaculia bacterium]|nr:aminotransferase class I/II-fold pyridoxal phosphate-dependent enzyme [Thermoanaerobaculia bacterium]